MTGGLYHFCLLYTSYLPLFAIVGGIMLAALAVILLCVDEPKLVAEQRRYEDAHPEDNLTQDVYKRQAPHCGHG